MGTRPGNRPSERGETLVEVMITVAILGIAVVAILGAIWTALRVADFHRKTTNADVVLRNFAEAIKANDVVAVGSGTFDATYKPCATVSGPNAYPTYSPPAPNTAYTAQITTIRYLQASPSSYSATGTPQWQATCPATDQGIQQLTLKVTGPNTDPTVRGTETVTVIKRDARGET